MSGIVFATSSCVSYHGGTPVALHIDDPWAADDPFVVARPDLFAPEPTKVGRTVAKTVAPSHTVEAATAAPGERRVVKRG